MQRESTQLWREVAAAPATTRATLDRSGRAIATAAGVLAGSRRIVVTGNGAAWYVANAMWLAALATDRLAPELVAVPAGVLASGALTWRAGDAMIVVSTSGELRDVVALLDSDLEVPIVAVTADPASSIGRAARAVVPTMVDSQDAVTHTQAYLGNLTSALGLWARIADDHSLADAVSMADQVLVDAVHAAADTRYDASVSDGATAVVAGTGAAWVAAQEAALLLAEIAGVPAYGMETREGATTGMYALGGDDLMVSISAGPPDDLLREAEDVCRERGARIVRLTTGAGADPRLAAISTFPAAAALAIDLGLQRGRDVDRPPWVDAYYRTARS
ncbi:hypothetical protein BH24ACT5_BH24ACT5_08840 [soil metagenome]